MKKYAVILMSIGICTILILMGVAQMSYIYVKQVDSRYQQLAQASDTNLLYPQIQGSAMGLDHIYALEQSVPASSSKSIVNFGNSTTILGVIETELLQDSDYDYISAAYGSATIPGLYVMHNFLTQIGYEQNEDTIIKIDISAALFKNRSLNQDILVSALEYADVYEVTDDYQVVEHSFSQAANFLGKSSHHVEKALTYLEANFTTGYDAMYETQSYGFTSYHRDMKINEENITLLENFISQFAAEQVVVEITYMHSALRASEAGKQFDAYVESTLIPYLETNNIAYLDARTLLDDTYYIDSTHLTYEGRRVYTKWVAEMLSLIN